jgi:hypothetical protein
MPIRRIMRTPWVVAAILTLFTCRDCSGSITIDQGRYAAA